jgi:hypothetical protein
MKKPPLSPSPFPYLPLLFLLMFALLPLIDYGWITSPAREVEAQDGRSAQNVHFVWPVSGSSQPDLPFSSAYGPRLQASSNFRYDYHQGIDIPAPISTTLYAVTTGTVRIAGSHPGYSDGVVQLNHGNNLYSNYLHISASLVVTDQVVGIGQPVALSGASVSGFPHLHFEIREGSPNRKDAVNPLNYLPYPGTISHTVAITSVTAAHSVWVRVETPANELDFNRLTVTVRRAGSNELLDTRNIDYEARNRQYNGNPDILDIADLENILIQPQKFNSSSTHYIVLFHFFTLQGSGLVTVEACGYDVKDQAVCATSEGFFSPSIYLPMIRS